MNYLQDSDMIGLGREQGPPQPSSMSGLFHKFEFLSSVFFGENVYT